MSEDDDDMYDKYDNNDMYMIRDIANRLAKDGDFYDWAVLQSLDRRNGTNWAGDSIFEWMMTA